VLVTAPSISAFSGTASTVGSLLYVNPAAWQNELPYELTGTISTVSATSAYLGASANATNGYYVGMWIVIITGTSQADNFVQTSAVIQGYDGGTKTATITQWINGNSLVATPTAGQTFKIIKSFPVDRKWQWLRNGSAITGQTSGSYTTQAADIGAQISVSEIAGFISDSNTGLTVENPAVTTTSTSTALTISGTANPRLVYNDNIQYQGSFRFPASGTSSTNNQSLPAFAAGGLFVKNSGGTKTLVVRGHKFATAAAEFAIPTTLGNAGPYSALPEATIVYPALAATELPLLTSGITISGDLLADGGDPILATPQQISPTKMLFSYTKWGGSGIGAHFRRPLDLSDQIGANVEGPFFIADQTYQTNSKWSCTWYCAIPSEWQAALGGDVFAGQGNPRMSYSSLSSWSQGPSAMSFNTANIDAALATKNSGNCRTSNSTTTIQLATGANATNDYYKNHCISVAGLPVRTITGYDGANKIATVDSAWVSAPTAGTAYFTIPPVPGRQLVGRSTSFPLQPAYNGYGTHMPIWNYSTVIGGMCIPDGTDSLLIFSRTGDNISTYFQWNLTGAAGQQNAGIKIYDPGNPDAGPHTGSSFLKVYAYDLNDLALVYQNAKSFNDAKPYGLLKLTLPASLDSLNRRVMTGVAYDSSAKRIYVSESSGTNESPIVHVWSVTNASDGSSITPPALTTWTRGTIPGSSKRNPNPSGTTPSTAYQIAQVYPAGFDRSLLTSTAAEQTYQTTLADYWERSTNGGATWTPITDFVGNQYLGSVYTTSAADIGAQIRVREVQTNINGTQTSTSSVFSIGTASRSSALVYPSDLEYKGAFRGPSANFYEFTKSGGKALSFDPAGNGGLGSIFASSNSFSGNAFGEITIPAPIIASTTGALNSASFTSRNPSPVEATEGQIDNSGIPANLFRGPFGSAVYNGKLIISANVKYANEIPCGIWRRPLTLATTGSLEGPVSLYSADAPSPRLKSGQMCAVPAAWQSALGGPVLTSTGSLSVNEKLSHGLDAFAFNPDSLAGVGFISGTLPSQSGVPVGSVKLAAATSGALAGRMIGLTGGTGFQSDASGGVRRITAWDNTTKIATLDVAFSTAVSTDTTYKVFETVASSTLLHYPLGNYAAGLSTALEDNASYINPGIFSFSPAVWTDAWNYPGFCIPHGTNSILFFGRTGNAFTRYYNDHSQYDPQYPETGPRAYPYYYRCWAYDLNDLAAVKAGTKTSYEVNPYAVWNFSLPIWSNGSELNGLCYDHVNRNIIISQQGPGDGAGNFGECIFHVIRVNNAVSQ
jgi:hypothetical protein